MGKIEESVFENYKTALEEGDLDQAQKAVEVAKYLRSKIEREGFVDYNLPQTNGSNRLGNFFEPFPYRYYPHDATVVIQKSAVTLTRSENRLFWLLTQNETREDAVKVITHQEIKDHLWGERKVTRNAVKAIIKRLRQKVEADPSDPRVLINHYGRGYIFLGMKSN